MSKLSFKGLALAAILTLTTSGVAFAQDAEYDVVSNCVGPVVYNDQTGMACNIDGRMTFILMEGNASATVTQTTTEVQMDPEPAAVEQTTTSEDQAMSYDTGSMPNLPKDLSHGQWTIKANANIGDDPIVRDWLGRLKDPAPGRWRTFPNVPNPDVDGFRVNDCGDNDPSTRCVPDGVEYGVASVPFCQQDETCDFVVPGWHYRLITADYSFQGETCGGEGVGCMLLLINVGEQTYTWRDQMADAGFSVPGRYWNGDTLEWGVWGLVSHASANMLNMPTKGLGDQVLNAEGGANAGANCGTVHGCNTVDVLVVVTAVDRILATARTTVSR